MADILGFLERLDDTRLVFVGRDADEPGTLYLGFRSAEGVDTKLKVSEEAFAALQRLYVSLISRSDGSHAYPESTGSWKGHWVVSHADFEH